MKVDASIPRGSCDAGRRGTAGDEGKKAGAGLNRERGKTN
jgi:hypothetical protein